MATDASGKELTIWEARLEQENHLPGQQNNQQPTETATEMFLYLSTYPADGDPNQWRQLEFQRKINNNMGSRAKLVALPFWLLLLHEAERGGIFCLFVNKSCCCRLCFLIDIDTQSRSIYIYTSRWSQASFVRSATVRVQVHEKA